MFSSPCSLGPPFSSYFATNFSSAWHLNVGMLQGSVLSSLPFLFCILFQFAIIIYWVTIPNISLLVRPIYSALQFTYPILTVHGQLNHNVLKSCHVKSKVVMFLPKCSFFCQHHLIERRCHFPACLWKKIKTSMWIPWLLLCLASNI